MIFDVKYFTMKNSNAKLIYHCLVVKEKNERKGERMDNRQADTKRLLRKRIDKRILKGR